MFVCLGSVIVGGLVVADFTATGFIVLGLELVASLILFVVVGAVLMVGSGINRGPNTGGGPPGCSVSEAGVEGDTKFTTPARTAKKNSI